MERQRVGRSELLRILVAETDRILGMSAISLRGKVQLAWRDGEPNWGASCGAANGIATRAFAVAVDRMQSLYELDEGSPSEFDEDSANELVERHEDEAHEVDLAPVDAAKVFARKTLDIADLATIKDRIDELQLAWGLDQDFMMLSAETHDPLQQDIYIGVPDVEMLAMFPGFQPIDRRSLPHFLATHVVRENGFEERYPDIASKRLRRF